MQTTKVGSNLLEMKRLY